MKSMFLTIDPGNQTGWAFWDVTLQDVELIACGLVEHVVGLTTICSDVWIESQVVYSRSKARPKDIISLAQTAGKWAGLYESLGAAIHWVEPAQWKGQLPKDVCHARMWSELSPREQKIVNRACKGMAVSKRHNVLDAVGIGIWVRKNFRMC